MGALSHLRVLDLSRVLAGPWAGQILADLGADVIKVERPGSGDDTRSWGPPYARNAQGEETSETAYFLCANRGKRSIAIDIAQPQGQEIIHQLVKQCDVLLENFKVGGLAAYGLDYPSLSVDNPGLIYCSITGFGQTGPYASRAGYDFAIQGMGGLMSVTGDVDGEPYKTGVAIADLSTGLYATIAIQAALAHREKTGDGQYIDMSLLDVQTAMLANQASNYLTTGHAPQRRGNSHPNIVPYQTFATADGHIIIAVGNGGQFKRLCSLIDRAELAEDSRFASNQQRVLHRAQLTDLLQQALDQNNSAHWLALCHQHQVPCAPVHTIDQVFADPQIRQREMQLDMAHPTADQVSLVANPIRLSKTPIDYQRPPPMLAEHSDDILQDLTDLDNAAIATLRRTGVIQ